MGPFPFPLLDEELGVFPFPKPLIPPRLPIEDFPIDGAISLFLPFWLPFGEFTVGDLVDLLVFAFGDLVDLIYLVGLGDPFNKFCVWYDVASPTGSRFPNMLKSSIVF